MKTKIEQFFKKRVGLAVTVLLLAIFALLFVMPRIYLSLDADNKKMFWGTFLLGSGIIMFVFFGQKSKKNGPTKEKVAVSSATRVPRSYQKLLDEVECCLEALKKHQIWAYGCLMAGWIIFLIGRWSGHPPYNQPIFAIPVFIIVLLAATKSLEEENELDANIAKYTLEGVELEKKRQGLKSRYFQDLANSYEGWGMWRFVFVRVSPHLMIIFSLLNIGPISLLAGYLSIPSWIVNCGAGIVVGVAFIFFARIASRPYHWLLEKMKTLPV